jgi:hypothetical protein
MGLFDRFLKAKQTAAPPPPVPPAPSVPPPSLPARATIETYENADAVGLLALANGDHVRFGRSACKGFEPVVGASVILEEVAASPRGWRAKAIDLDPSDGRYDALIAARDRALGLPSRTMGNEEAAATARQLAVITVLLEEALPEGTLALRKWAAERGFPRDGIDSTSERDLEFSIAGGSVLTYVGRSQLPKERLDTRNLPEDFEFGRSFIGLGTGLPGVDRQTRLALSGARDCWAMDGNLRNLSRLVRMLADRATGFVLHRAGDLVVPAGEFVRMLGDLDDPDCRPFAAWLDVGISDRNGEKVYATFGMDAFGLPDVVVPVQPDDRFSRSRRHEAVLHACYRMVRENRELEAGETLRVPIRLNIGAWPVELDGKEAAFTYSVAEDGSLLKLVSVEEIDPAREWRVSGASIAVNAYQALFDRGLAEVVPSDLVRDVPARNPDVIPHSVEVRARHDGRGFIVVTNGFGRRPQRHVDRADCTHIEVAAWAPTHAFELVQLVGTLAGHAHRSTAGGWKPADTLGAPIEEFGIGGFVLADGGAVGMGGGPAVRLLLLVPLTAREYELVRGGGAADWLSKNTVDERRWASFVARID